MLRPRSSSRMHRVQLGGAGLEGSFPENNGVDPPGVRSGRAFAAGGTAAVPTGTRWIFIYKGSKPIFGPHYWRRLARDGDERFNWGDTQVSSQARAYVAANLNLRLLLEDLFLTLYEELEDGPRH